MALLQTADRQNTANQIIEWNKQAIQAINTAKQYFNMISSQLEAMKTSPL